MLNRALPNGLPDGQARLEALHAGAGGFFPVAKTKLELNSQAGVFSCINIE